MKSLKTLICVLTLVGCGGVPGSPEALAADAGAGELICQPGPQGPQGAPGAVGPKGDKGDQGAKGEMGAVGPQGPKGDKGDPGAAGTCSETVCSTLPGPQGPKGDPGAPGAPGVCAPSQCSSTPGATGPAGPKGDKGDTGATGDVGPKGDKGEKGDPGATPKGILAFNTVPNPIRKVTSSGTDVSTECVDPKCTATAIVKCGAGEVGMMGGCNNVRSSPWSGEPSVAPDEWGRPIWQFKCSFTYNINTSIPSPLDLSASVICVAITQ